METKRWNFTEFLLQHPLKHRLVFMDQDVKSMSFFNMMSLFSSVCTLHFISADFNVHLHRTRQNIWRFSLKVNPSQIRISRCELYYFINHSDTFKISNSPTKFVLFFTCWQNINDECYLNRSVLCLSVCLSVCSSTNRCCSRASEPAASHTNVFKK